MDDRARKRRLSDTSVDEVGLKKGLIASAKSTPAPPERTATPEVERARRLEEVKMQAEAKRKAAEAEARKREDEEAARKAAEEEEEARKKAEAEAEARAKLEAEAKAKAKLEAEAKAKAKLEAEAIAKAKAEAQRLAEEEAEAALRREREEEAKRLAKAEAEARRQKELLARQDRIARLPRALRRACERGTNRPLHFSPDEVGVSFLFLPLFWATAQDLKDPQAQPDKVYICSYQLAGILGLPELDLARLEPPFSNCPRIPVSPKQREVFLRKYDVARLAQVAQFPKEGAPDFDFGKICESMNEAKAQFMAMDGLYWIEDSLLYSEVEKIDTLRPLLERMKQDCKQRYNHLSHLNSDRLKPKRTFLDLIREQNQAKEIVATPPVVNGNG